MYTPLIILLPLLASTSAKPHQPRSPHANAHNHAGRDRPPLAIYNNVLLTDRAESYSDAAKRHFEIMGRSPAPVENKGQEKRLVRRVKKRACKAQAPNAAPSASTSASDTSIIGHGAFATGSSSSPSASVPAAGVTASPTASDDEAWYYYTSAYASASSAAVQGGSSLSSPPSAAPSSASPSSSSAAESSSAVSPSPSTGTGGGGGSKSNMLFPLGRGTASWSTCTEESGSMSISDALNPLSAGKLPTEGTAPDGSSALVANFPAGTVKLASGQGFSFYTEGTKNNVYAPGAKEVVFSYSAFFEDGFQFAKGGKLPGLFGGTSFETAKSCSGGKEDGRDKCFSARMMWRNDGMGEAYNYYPTSVQQANGYCSIAPKSVCNPDFGDSIGRGSFYWTAGKWTTVAQRLKLNDVGQSNGEQEIFINGQSVLKITDLQIAVDAETKIYGIMAQTFFGGSDSSWASPRDQNIWFKDFSFAVIS